MHRIWMTAFLGVSWMIAATTHAHPIRVACVGDSITAGTGLSDPSSESYPPKLQLLLGTNYLVQNFGVSGRSLLKSADLPYWRESAYTNSLSFLPDIVIIKLGSNDSRPFNWKHSTNFVSDYLALINSYQTLPSQPRVILSTPCPAYRNGAFEIRPAVIRNEIVPAVMGIARQRQLDWIDFHTGMDGHPEWFPDLIHPDFRGTSVMASLAWRTVTGEGGGSGQPALAAGRNSGNQLTLAWPANQADWMLQGLAAFRTDTNQWIVLDSVARCGGDGFLRWTNISSLPSRYFRLWRPQ